MGTVAIAIMVASAIGMIYGLSKQKAGKAWGRPVAVICAVLALFGAIFHMMQNRQTPIEDIIKIEQAYQSVAGEKLGQYLAANNSGSKVLIIAEHTDATKPIPYLEGLKKGLGSSMTIVKEVAPEPDQALIDEYKKNFAGDPAMEAEGYMPPREEWYTPAKFDALVAPYMKKCDIIISTIDLPMEAKGMKFWREAKAPKLAMVNGSTYELKPAFAAKKLIAAVSHHPEANYDDPSAPPADLDEAFDKRWLLITSENIGDVSAKYTDMFVK